jgi:hypothetical protein
MSTQAVTLRGFGCNYLRAAVNTDGLCAQVNANGVDIVAMDCQGGTYNRRLSTIRISGGGAGLKDLAWAPDHVKKNHLLCLMGNLVQVWNTKAPPLLVFEHEFDKSLTVYSADWTRSAIPAFYLFHKNGVVLVELPRENSSSKNRVCEFAVHKRVLNCATPSTRGYMLGTSIGETVWDKAVPERSVHMTSVAAG